MKKLIILMCVAMAALNNFAKTGDKFNNNGITFQVTASSDNGGEVAVIALYDTAKEEVLIPSLVTYDGLPYKVNSISPNAFRALSLTTVSIPNGLTEIERGAFQDCTHLTTVTLPSSLLIIGDFAFAGCRNLTNVSIPTNIEYIGRQAFADCLAITDVSIPRNIKSMGVDVFHNCTALTNVTLPVGMDKVSEGAFEMCRAMKKVDFPNTVKIIDSHAFNGCEALTDAMMDENIVGVGEYAFAGCKNLSTISIPCSITGLPDGVFAYCTGLKSVTLPNSVTAIGSGTFAYDQALTHVTLPSWLETLGVGDNGGAFDRCDAMTELTIPASVQYVGDVSAFPYGLNSIYVMGEKIPEGLQNMYPKNRMGEDVTIYVKHSVYNKLYNTGEWNGIRVDYRIPIKMVNAKGNTVKYKTLCRDFDIDLRHTNDNIPVGTKKLTAYVVDDADEELSMVFMDEIWYIPSRLKANVEGYIGVDEYVGIVVKGSPGVTYYYEIGEYDYSQGTEGQWLLSDAQAASRAPHAGKNMMKGAADAKLISTTEVDDETGATMTNYGLNNNTFKMISGPGWLGYNKSYLPIPENMANANLTMQFTNTDGTTEIINYAEFYNDCDDGNYDLQGRKVYDNTKGIVIHNGKKIIRE